MRPNDDQMTHAKARAQVGCCGFRLPLIEYARLFSVVEIQQTFYQPPQIKTLERWRAESPHDFEFVIKAWQLITHESRSPTYRRLRRKLTDAESAEAGFFKPPAIVREAWEVTAACSACSQGEARAVSVSGEFHRDAGEHCKHGAILFFS